MRKEADLGGRQGRRFRFRNGTMDFDAGWVLGGQISAFIQNTKNAVTMTQTVSSMTLSSALVGPAGAAAAGTSVADLLLDPQ